MDEKIYLETLNKMKQDSRLLCMEQYPQHGSCNTYKHSVNVATYSFYIAKYFGIDVHEKDLARGAMLHDFYLYNIKESGYSAYKHGTGHADIALQNAMKHFELTDIEKDIIYSHMWPLNLFRLPKYKESVIVGAADKISAVIERYMQIYMYFYGYILRKNMAWVW